MLIDARKDIDQNLFEADICIIGAGPAGISIAKSFSNSPIRLCLLESGGLEFDRDTQALYEGDNVGLDYFPLDATRLRYFGGTSNHWGGMCAPLWPIDFEDRDWVTLSGWPFDFKHIEPYYRSAQEICELGPFDYGVEQLEQLLSARRLPLDAERFFSFPIQYSPPTRFGERYRSELQAAPNVAVFLHTNAVRIDTNEASSEVTGVQCRTISGTSFNVKGKLFVLAAGGIENPRILLLSNERQSVGLGNGADLVGRYFMEHPQWRVGVLIPEDPMIESTLYDWPRWHRENGIRANAFISPTPKLQRDERLLSGMIALNLRFAAGDDGLVVDGLNYLDRVGMALRRRDLIDSSTYRSFFERDRALDHFDVIGQWEQTPNPRSRVKLSSKTDQFDQNQVELDWHIDRGDLEAMEKTLQLFGQAVGAAGIGRLKLDIETDDGPGGNHHMGTTRMHPDPTMGVVDEHCQVHGIQNLYIAGSSVFPTASSVNPTLTIVALALRLSETLKERLT